MMLVEAWPGQLNLNTFPPGGQWFHFISFGLCQIPQSDLGLG